MNLALSVNVLILFCTLWIKLVSCQTYSGNNVALNQPTHQSSTYSAGSYMYGSDRAVDGLVSNQASDLSYCSHTDDHDANPWFEVTFPRSTIFTIVIYNRDNDCCKDRLSFCKLEIFDGETTVNVTRGPDMSNKISFATDYVPSVVATRVNVSTTYKRRSDSNPFLTICEIQIYAVSACSQGMYGVNCQSSCSNNCFANTCDTTTGECNNGCSGYSDAPTCSTSCIQGMYGRNCQSRCKDNCYDNKCDTITGVCNNGCNGFSNPPTCSTPCILGKYGKNCQSSCSSNCFGNSCDRITGVCDNGCNGFSNPPTCTILCSQGHYGQNCLYTCDECFNMSCDRMNGRCQTGCNGFSDPPICSISCSQGMFGLNCLSSCSNCYDNFCDTKTGVCLNGCIGYNNPPTCTRPCSHGTYGHNCQSSCSISCFNETCDRKTGVCDNGCIGFSNPPTCNIPCTDGFYEVNCRKNCSIHCDKPCNKRNGNCSCLPGYTGRQCDQECPNGTYEAYCTKNCSSHCVSGCDKTNGFCICQPGYTNNTCNAECNATFFGQNCTSPCSSKCLNKHCDHVTGVCLNCPNGTHGDKCKECATGSFGYNCSENCSSNCNPINQCNAVNGLCDNGCIDGFFDDTCDQECYNNTFGRNCTSECSLHCSGSNDTNSRVCDNRDGHCFGVCLDGYIGAQCTQALGTSQDPPVGVIVGVIIAAIVIVLVIVAGVIFWKRRHPTKKNGLARETRTVLRELPESLSLKSKETIETSVDDDEYQPETTYYNTSSELGVNMAIKVIELNTYMQTHDKQFFLEQFKKIPQAQNVTTQSALSDENKSKNRYKNICPYDHSRVNLLINKERKEGDYINASYIQDNNSNVKFIASQGPNKTMINDFIRMLWEQKTEVVVMLTNFIEEGKMKCERYWPESGKTSFGEIKVKLKKTQIFADYTIRRIELEKFDEEPRLFTHFHFTSWPDQSTPTAPWALVDFAQKVFAKSTTSPIVVHCSAGVGRTGTFIALHNILQQAEETGQVDFYNILVKLRKDRIFMIQTGDQYAFLHRAAQVAILCNETYMELKDINGSIKRLKQTKMSKLTIMEQEFQSLKAVSDDIRHSQDDETGNENVVKEQVYQNAIQLKQEAKNRFPSIIPRNCDRPFLNTYGKEKSDYINAVFVQGSHKKDHHILTQLPMPATVTDLWRLVTQYKISLMVAFEAENVSKDETMAVYLPTTVKGVTLSSDYFEVKCMNFQQDELWEEQTLKVRSDKSKSDCQDVVHLKCKFTNLESKYLLRLVKKIKSYNLQADGKILYMCRDGATYSGLCCVLSNLLDRLDSDSSLSVPLVVGAVKTVRPEVIPNMEQYRTVYEVLEKYSDTSMPYTNMDENYFPRDFKPVKNKPPLSETTKDENINVYNNV